MTSICDESGVSQKLECRKEMETISEMHADDFHLDHALHLACNQVTYYLVSGALMVTIPRQDREQLCPRVQAGEGRVYRCLMT